MNLVSDERGRFVSAVPSLREVHEATMDLKRGKLLLQRLCAVLLLAAIAPTAWTSDWVYRIRLHDNIWDLSNRYLKPEIPWQKLQDYNQVSDPLHLPPGMTLRVPIAWLRVQPASATVVALSGSAHVRLAGQEQTAVATVGMPLTAGSSLTTDENSSVMLQFADGSHLLLQESGQLDFDEMSAYGQTGMVDTRLRLQHGRVSTEVTPMTGSGAHFIVTNPRSISSVRGTHFRVATNLDQSQTEVLTGRVDVASHRAHVLVGYGMGITVAEGSPPSHAQSQLQAPVLHCPSQPISQLPYPIEWDALSEAKSYRVQMTSGQGYQTPLIDRITDALHADLPDAPDGDYVVQVRGIDHSLLEGLDAVCTIRTSAHPQPPLVIFPLPDSKVRERRPRFSWTENQQASSYFWELASDVRFSQILASEEALTGKSVQAPQAFPFGHYYWRIASRDHSGKLGPFSNPMSFDLVPEPSTPQMDKPTLVKGKVRIGWQRGGLGYRYHVQLDRNPRFEHPQLDQELDQNVFDIPKPGGGTWYMRLQVIDTDGYAGPWSDTQKVRVSCMACRVTAIGGGVVLLWVLL
ncbi:FecR domain-containing protein [Dyella japonica]|uniref:FecR domain-containing protein n=1 Tax=Dyella japonica TaxID=231455 RepID=UPI0011859F1A|nr:FecR domain-containing protein [Dyella japonica]